MIGRKALRATVGVGIAGAVMAVASPVSGHVGVDAEEIEAGAATALGFSFSHGCGDEPTTSLRFEIPATVNQAVPQSQQHREDEDCEAGRVHEVEGRRRGEAEQLGSALVPPHGLRKRGSPLDLPMQIGEHLAQARVRSLPFQDFERFEQRDAALEQVGQLAQRDRQKLLRNAAARKQRLRVLPGVDFDGKQGAAGQGRQHFLLGESLDRAGNALSARVASDVAKLWHGR